jgi:hypothetical protein
VITGHTLTLSHARASPKHRTYCAARRLVRAALRAAALRTCRPLVRTALRAAARRAAAVRCRAVLLACRASARRLAAARDSRRNARRIARERRIDVRRRRTPRDASALFVLLVPAFVPCGGSSTPARRAFERPMAMACLAERAPCFPSRTCRISSRTNSPACVVGALPARLSLRARSIVLCSGMSSTTSTFLISVSSCGLLRPDGSARPKEPNLRAVRDPPYASSAPRVCSSGTGPQSV